MNTEDERQMQLLDSVYQNDVIMLNILTHIPSYKDRLSLERSCRRLYYLSSRCPCSLNHVLRLTICYYDAQKEDVLIFLEKQSGTGFKKISDLTFLRKKHNYGDTLDVLSRRFAPEIRSILYQDNLNDAILRQINYRFRNVVEITCRGFTVDGLRYLNSEPHFLRRRLKLLGFLNFQRENESRQDCFKSLDSLRQITCWIQQDWPLEAFLKELEVIPKLDQIYIKHLSANNKDAVDLLKISKCCRDLKFSDPVTFNAGMLSNLCRVSNLTHLDITLLHLSQTEVINLFSTLRICQLKSVILTECRYFNDLLALIKSGHSFYPKLEDLKLKSWEIQHGTTTPLLTICPKSLKRLGIDDCIICPEDLEFVKKNCPNLIEFSYKPSLNDALLIDSSDENSKLLLSENLCQTLLGLPALERFAFRDNMDPEFIQLLCNNLTKVQEAEFYTNRIKQDQMYRILKIYFKNVNIVQNDVKTCEEIEENDVSGCSNIDDTYLNKYLKEWKTAVDQARRRTLQNCSWFMDEYLTSDVQLNGKTQWKVTVQNRRMLTAKTSINFSEAIIR